MSLETIPIKIYADGADLKGIIELYQKTYIAGLTTNPTLMRKAGISDYERFAMEVLEVVTNKPISLEVFSDDLPEMRRQALKISKWGSNVFVKIPVCNTQGLSTMSLVSELAKEGVKLNITAILTLRQVAAVADALEPNVPAVVSVFAGRIADTGVEPEPLMLAAKALLTELPTAELLWASVREVLNIFQAARCGTAIVTVPHDILAKAAKMTNMDLDALSLDTVKMFRNDALAAGYTL